LPLDLAQGILPSEIAGAAGPGVFVHAKFIFRQQPPKQPLAQNNNGSQFGRLASY
jgi:hypothetical protein